MPPTQRPHAAEGIEKQRALGWSGQLGILGILGILCLVLFGHANKPLHTARQRHTEKSLVFLVHLVFLVSAANSTPARRRRYQNRCKTKGCCLPFFRYCNSLVCCLENFYFAKISVASGATFHVRSSVIKLLSLHERVFIQLSRKGPIKRSLNLIFSIGESPSPSSSPSR